MHSNHTHNLLLPKRNNLLRRILNCWQLYVFLIPALLYIIIYRYGPILGLQLAFKQYIPKKGISGSPWVGLKQFIRFFSAFRFKQIFWNTIILAVYRLLIVFPLPIILALALNEVRRTRLKRTIQTITYIPFFISIVVVIGMTMQLFSPHYGILSGIIKAITGKETDIMSNPNAFRHIFVWTDVWQLTGYQAILYIAALSAVPPELHEAAMIDGATKFQRVLKIDFPSILPTATILLILETGKMLDISYEKVLLLQNPLNLRTSEILTTYIYKAGIQDGYFDFATAGTLFNSLINFALIITVNAIARKMGETSLW
ncbi:MAG: sugar ABC transporter permease [Spirochaetales bacterium]|nr:sugar ABC transporter permease [Spirochaetales bacterium]